MKKTIFGMILTGLLAVSMAVTALAAPSDDDWNVIYGRNDLYVTYQADGKWTSNLGADWDDPLSNIQPGDKVVLSVQLNNDYEGKSDWYMSNSVLRTLEDASSATNGGYTYVLTYTNAAGVSEDLYNSEVGGEDSEHTAGGRFREGLKEATDGLENTFYLDTLNKGEKARVTLEVTLDGESQGNAYQDTLAQLQLVFGVEDNMPTTKPEETTKKQEQTTKKGGNPSTNDTTAILPYMILMVGTGVGILTAAIVLAKKRKKDGKAGE